MRLKLLVFITFIFLPLKLLFGVKEPEIPKVPDIDDSKTTNRSVTADKNESLPAEQTELYTFKVNIIFQDKTILNGITSFSKESIKVKHKKNGFIFRKNLKWSEVKNLQILEWKPVMQSQNTNTHTILYYFYPYKWKIISKRGDVYYYEGNIPYINKLILTNDDGSTDIYSYFIDYWKITGENSGYWKNMKSVDFYYPFKNPNNKVFKTINFR